MFEIKGKVNTAICFAKVIEDEAIEQIRRMCDNELSRDSQIRIMPDVHAGKSCTIGTTMTIVDKVVPNIVGVDIGCGMYTVKLGKSDIDFEKVDEACHVIPSGFSTWDRDKWNVNLTKLRCYDELQKRDKLIRSLGTLGGGNHFIEIDQAKDGTKYLVIHSGSRGLGLQVAGYYQKLAIELNSGTEEYIEKRNQLVEEYRATGRMNEIQDALSSISKEKRDEDLPDDMCYLYGPYLDDYLHDVTICQEFARMSREKIAEVIIRHAGLEAADSFHTVHNYIDTNEMILRKGAIAAHEGELVLIPINMRDGSVLAVGKGNPDWNYSAPHGAGRIMSRSKAKDNLEVEEYRKAMEGIYSTSVGESTLDEAPMAYKSLEDIIDVIEESVDMIEVLRPIFNFKAS